MDGENRKKPQRIINKSNKQSTPTIRKIGLTLVEELDALIDRLGENNPALNGEILAYIQKMKDCHPEWIKVFDQHYNTRIPGSTARSGRLPHAKI